MPEVRTFQADSMQAALDRVRREMGEEAIILNTKQSKPKRRWLSLGQPKELVEVTAGLGIQTKAATRKAKRKTAPTPRPAPPMTPQQQHAADIIGELTRQGISSPLTSGGLDFTTPDQPAPALPMPQQPRISPSTSQPDQTEHLAKRLDSLQRSIEKIDQTRSLSSVPSLNEVEEYFYDLLVDGDVEPSIAEDMLRELSGRTPAEIRGQLKRRIEQRLRCRQPIQITPGQRKTVALVGATGVGKTTTIAKLAANFKMAGHQKLALITIDTFRVAAVEQLKTYADIIDLPMQVVTNATQMSSAIQAFQDMDLIFIDTAGRSPRDREQIQELKRLLEVAQANEIHQVVSLTSSRKSLLTSIERFSPVGVNSLIISKLDEAEGAGGLLSVSQSSGLPIGYFTTGQGVPDDIEPARASTIARMLIDQGD